MSMQYVCRQNAGRPMLARLQLLSKLVPLLGVQSGSGEGIPLEGLMKFVGLSFGSASAEVRSAAVDLTILVATASRCPDHFWMPASLKSEAHKVLLWDILELIAADFGLLDTFSLAL